MALSPEDVVQIKSIIKDDIAKPTEGWSWRKFLSGFIDGRCYAKTVVFLFCSLVIITICTCVYLVAKEHLVKKPQPTDTSTITGQTVTQNIDKSQETISKTYLPFSGPLINFGSNGKTQKEE